MLKPYPRATILDVGGGHGQTASALIQNGYQLTVLGSSNACQERIRSHVLAGQCTFQVGNILDLPYPDQSFEVVLTYRLLPHVARWEEFLAELTRVAARAIILDYPEVRSINYITPLLFSFKKKLEGNTRTYTCFRESELLEAFNRHGFRKAGRYAEFFLPMVLHRKLKTPGISSAVEKLFRATGLTGIFGSPVILKLARAEGG
jgi:ubiquinone/menaquinone biosynthesis C-methylase UbiE